MAPGFKPVGWVAAVAVAAIGCYMVSLNVAAERAELARVERQIVAAKQQIRSLQTELGTRGRLAQLEQWNAEVLALSAPTSAQFLESEIKLARFERPAPTLEERVPVHMASADTGTAKVGEKAKMPVIQAAAPAKPALATPTLVRRASLDVTPRKPLDMVKSAGPLDDKLIREIGAAARVEAGSGGR
jgi:hypothetical protein